MGGAGAGPSVASRQVRPVRTPSWACAPESSGRDRAHFLSRWRRPPESGAAGCASVSGGVPIPGEVRLAPPGSPLRRGEGRFEAKITEGRARCYGGRAVGLLRDRNARGGDLGSGSASC